MTDVQQKDLFTRRWRKVRRLEPKELQIQIALIQHLKVRARRGVLYFHVPNGETHDERAGAKLKAMGVLRGVADMVFIWSNAANRVEVLFLELKARRGRLSDDQKAFSLACFHCGAHYRVANSIDAAIAELNSFSLLKS